MAADDDDTGFSDRLRNLARDKGARITHTGGLAFSPVAWDAFAASLNGVIKQTDIDARRQEEALHRLQAHLKPAAANEEIPE